MLKNLLTAVSACAVLCAMVAATAQDESKEVAENREQAKAKIALMLAKSQMVRVMGEKGTNAAKVSTKGRPLIERKYEMIIAELRQKHDLTDWEPDESEQLIAIRSAAAEFLDAFADARDNIRRKMQTRDKNKAPAPGPKMDLGPGPSGDMPLNDMNRWRGDVIRQGEQFYNSVQNTGDEKDLRQAWRSIQNHVIEMFDRLLPLLLADRHVIAFHQEGLIQRWTRLESAEDLALRLPGYSRFHVVVYQIDDAYGTPRRGSVVVGLPATKSWEVAKENDAKGGFYELTKLED